MSDEAEPHEPAVKILSQYYQTLLHDFAGEDDAYRQNEGMQRVEHADRHSKAADVVRYCTDASTDRMCSFDVIESCLQKLDNDVISMYELACYCLNGSISDESVHQIADSAVFKTQLNQLARNYALGLAEPDNDCEAFLLFKLVEDQNDPEVLCALARAYQFGWGVEKDVPKAVEYYVKAADAGSFAAMDRLYDLKDKHVDEYLKAAFYHFKQQTDAGNANAAFATAYCYCYGIGVAENDYAAIKMCYNTVYQYNSNALVLLAYMYVYGSGVEENQSKAFELRRQAANAGNKEGQYWLGRCYEYADRVAKDFYLAAFWYYKATAQGHADAANCFGYCYQNGYGVEKDYSRAFYYYKQAAIVGSMGGQRYVADCYYNGNGVKYSYKQAAYWYQKATDQGRTDAAYNLNHCFEWLRKTRGSNTGIPQTEATQSVRANQQHEIAFFLVKLAAELGCGKAFSCLGDCYFNGICTARDIAVAANCYYKTEPSDSQKYLNLVKCLETGYVDENNELNLFSTLIYANTALRTEINKIQSQMQ